MKNTIIICLLVIISFGLGFYCSTEVRNNTGVNNTFAAGWEAARKRLEETGQYFMIDTTYSVKEIWGEVKNISGSKLTISIQPLDPLADSSLDERIVTVDKSTTLLQQIKKSDSEYNKELADYNNINQDYLGGPVLPDDYPNMFKESPISIGDLQIGQKIKVETDHDVRNTKEFRAKNILIQYPGN